ncbi:MAG: ABC transporter ATP-binding protein [Candidatus Eremiobacteraeota bacterium]|nr:ABC transporter ATP-binding protein [Candidatus Eremiobacteraeota bacterium]
MTAASLRVEKVCVHFGGVVALDDVSFEARSAEVLGIIGPNGAGKTTLFNTISGVQRPLSGRVSLGERELTGRAIHAIATLGVLRTFQTPMMFWGLTVRESVMVALSARATIPVERTLFVSGLGLPARRREDAALREEADALLAGTPLEALAGAKTETLSFGQERMLEIVRTLARRPQVLLLDEPLSGLNPAEIERVLTLVREVRERGVVVLFVEHDLHNLLTAVDRLVVLDHGRKIAEGAPAAVTRDPLVVDAYIGDEVA